MALALTLLGVVLAYFSPGNLFPELAPYHPQQIILLPAAFAAFVSALSRRAGLHTLQAGLMLGLWFAVVMSFPGLSLRARWNSFFTFGLQAVVFFLVLTTTFSVRRIRVFCMAMVVATIALVIESITAYHTGYLADQLVLSHVDGDGMLTMRIQSWGSLADPNDFSQIMVVALSLLGLLWRPRRLVLNFIRVVLPGALLVYGTYLSGSRGAIVGLAAVAWAALAPRLGKTRAVIVSCVLLALMIATQFGGGREISLLERNAGGRVVAWGDGIAQLKSHPIFGVGFGNFTEYTDLTAHNSFVLCFAELGLFGYFFWLALIVTCLWSLEILTRMPVQSDEDRRFRQCATVVRAALYGFLATGWFLSRTYTLTLYILLALASSLIQMRKVSYPRVEVPTSRWLTRTVALQFLSVILFYLIVRLRNLNVS